MASAAIRALLAGPLLLSKLLFALAIPTRGEVERVMPKTFRETYASVEGEDGRQGA